MRRFRWRRRRIAALALLSLAASTTTMTIAMAAATASPEAAITSSDHRVSYGKRVTLRGSFPGAVHAPVTIRHRAKGTDNWRTVAQTQTSDRGRYSVKVKPRSSGYWRAELAAATHPQSAPSAGAPEATPAAESASLDSATPAERVIVRSRIRAHVGDRHAVASHRVPIRGHVAPAGAKRRVVIEVGGDRITTTAQRDGSFRASWRAGSTGTYNVHVHARGNRVAAGSSDRAGRVTVYRRAAASWYGPGLYGNVTACGQTLTPSTLGVAHKTLPCGTKMRLRYGNRTVAVRVIDRGPFSGSREFDLTYAAKRRLGFPDLGTVLTSR